MSQQHFSSIAVLIATRNREALLMSRAFPSLVTQSLQPSLIVVVNDGDPFGKEVVETICDSNASTETAVLANERSPGAAGAWNTGLEWLWKRGHRGFVAILDDDDQWDTEHLAINTETASQAGANLVVSGLRMYFAGVEQPRSLIERLSDRDFLIGNPGWQGSNTFVSLPLLRSIGGFREGLPSLNDRDLAIRLLRRPITYGALTNRWTASWHRDTPGNLSSPMSPDKIAGLQWFWRIYGLEMTETERTEFFSRAERFFWVSPGEIIG